MSETKNQGEGDRESARRYDHHVEQFVAEGKVEPAALSAEAFVQHHPAEATKAERAAERGPHGMFAELVAKGRTLIERMRGHHPKK